MAKPATKPTPEEVARLRYRAYARSPLVKAMRRALRATEAYLAELEVLRRAQDASNLYGVLAAAGVPVGDGDEGDVEDMLDTENALSREVWGVTWAVEYMHDFLASNVVRRPSRSRRQAAVVGG